MAHGKLKYLYYLDGWGYFFKPTQANRVDDGLEITRQDYITLRLQAVSTTDFSLNTDFTVPDAATVDWSNYSDAITGVKTAANYTAGGDYTVAFSGFDTGDTTWINAAKGRLSFAIAFTSSIAPGPYLSEIKLIDGSNTNRIPDLPLPLNLVQELVIGTEPTTPSGISGNSGTAIIPARSDSVTVSFTGMTATGLVIPSWIGNPLSTLGASCTTNSFTIKAGGPMDVNTTVGYYVAKTS
jgi:hypothetical protein